jgi:hypothetical protein
VEATIRKAVESHTEYNFELKIDLPSGKPRWLMQSGAAFMMNGTRR